MADSGERYLSRPIDPPSLRNSGESQPIDIVQLCFGPALTFEGRLLK